MPISGAILGNGVQIPQPDLVNPYGCQIESQARIGAFVEVQKNAVIGERRKVSSHSFVCEGVVIEDEVFIRPRVVFTNAFYPGATALSGGRTSLRDAWRRRRPASTA